MTHPRVTHPLQALADGHWFKLICGASFQHLPAIRYLTIAYTLAGADCIDVAADPAVLRAVQAALPEAEDYRAFGLASSDPTPTGRPFIMVSLNDGEDPHFRKAMFDPRTCPPTCDRPCERSCPTAAIPAWTSPESSVGVLADRCYGCGRCLPVCPVQHITTQATTVAVAAIAPLVLAGVDAVEIHTQIGRLDAFQQVWQAVQPWVGQLQVVAVSCPDGVGVQSYLRSLYEIMAPLPIPLIWQADGRPMSGDIGPGTTHATIRFGQKLLAANLPGYVQLAGGTNAYTVTKLRSLELLAPTPRPAIAGIAYGSYARTLLGTAITTLDQLDQQGASLAAKLPVLRQAVQLARSLVAPLKTGPNTGSVALTAGESALALPAPAIAPP